MKKFFQRPLLLAMIVSAITIPSVSVYAQSVDTQVDTQNELVAPTYTAIGKSDDNGLTDHYLYTFVDGTKDAAPGDCLLMVNGSFTIADVLIRNELSLVPIRIVSEAFGADVIWDDAAKAISITYQDQTISMTIGQEQATVNGDVVPLAVAPVIENGKTYVPLRFVSTILNKSVGYLPAGDPTSTLYLQSIEEPNAAKGLAYNPIVWIDDLPEKLDKAELLLMLQNQFEQGVALLQEYLDTPLGKTFITIQPDDPVFVQLAENMKNTYYIDQVGRYAMFQGPYIILVDTVTEKIYFYTIAHASSGVWEADINNLSQFVPMYFAN